MEPPDAEAPDPASLRPVPFREALRFWIRLGFINFGGPTGQIALMHTELVERRRWIDEGSFLHALNFAMLLPGPEAHQLAIYVGWLLNGTPGALAAGVFFLLPAFVLMVALSWLFVVHGEVTWLVGRLRRAGVGGGRDRRGGAAPDRRPGARPRDPAGDRGGRVPRAVRVRRPVPPRDPRGGRGRPDRRDPAPRCEAGGHGPAGARTGPAELGPDGPGARDRSRRLAAPARRRRAGGGTRIRAPRTRPCSSRWRRWSRSGAPTRCSRT